MFFIFFRLLLPIFRPIIINLEEILHMLGFHFFNIIFHLIFHLLIIILLFLLLLFKEVGSARLRESDIHPISPKTTAPQYQPIDRKKTKGKIVEDFSRDRAA